MSEVLRRIDVAKIDLAELKAAAEKATPGPWTENSNHFGQWWVTDAVGTTHVGEGEGDVRHIANCDPQTILALIELVNRIERWATTPGREKWSSQASRQAYEQAQADCWAILHLFQRETLSDV